MTRTFQRRRDTQPPCIARTLGTQNYHFPDAAVTVLLLSVFCGCGVEAEQVVDDPAVASNAHNHDETQALQASIVSDAAEPPGAGMQKTPEASAEISAKELSTIDAAAAVTFGKIKFKHDGGEIAFSLKSMPDGAKLVDAAEKEIARYNLSGNKLKIKDSNDQVLAYIVMAKNRIHIEDARQEKRLWKFGSQADGDWKLEDPTEALVTRVKKREYGWEYESPSDRSLGKIKVKGEKTSCRDAQEKTVLYTKDKVPSLAMACITLDAIKDKRIRAGLAVAIMIDQGE